MASDDHVIAGESDWPITNPWPFLLFGLGSVSLALCLKLSLKLMEVPGEWPATRVALLVLGLVAAGLAVSIRPRSAVVVAGAAVAGFIALYGFDVEWDTARMLVKV